MVKPKIEVVALIGTGIVGRGWMRVFSGAGCQTRVYDKDEGQLKRNSAWFERVIQEDIEDGLISPEEGRKQRDLLSAHTELDKALKGAGTFRRAPRRE
ncbi:MAG: hypothetical protein JRJ59_03950 [Deltaproteobacteria bacterium]|nr:hypothetical protein [Deltaproteobacteria bacterium]